MNMTIDDIKEYRENAVKILKRNDQYATARAVDQAFSALVCLEQFKWERDIAIDQLKELGIGFGQKIDGKYLTKEEYEQLIEYEYRYDGLCK